MLGTIAAQLSLDLSIWRARRRTSIPKRKATRTISGASLRSWLVDVVTASAAAGSIPVHSPTKYVFDNELPSKIASLLSSRLDIHEPVSQEQGLSDGHVRQQQTQLVYAK